MPGFTDQIQYVFTAIATPYRILSKIRPHSTQSDHRGPA